MKTLLVIMATTLTVSFANAQKMKDAEVPPKIKDAFKKEFPGSKAKEWAKEGDAYEIEFDLKKVETSATFTAEGKLVETEAEIAITELPKAVAEYVKKNHPNHKITEASKITEAGTGKVSYEAEISKGKEEMDLIFDDKGTFLKKEGNDNSNDKD
ncbi:MAG TPA: PepSY-like domain-containing protein [Bacteroidia bacterium]|nr:PepSY-like domain-containing protein [Bacteroidia bacterium]